MAASPKTLPAPAIPADDPVRARILQAARAHLFAHGYCRCTMDELARELGVSKKTLYQHFPGKEELVREVLVGFGAEVRTHADAILRQPDLSFPGRLQAFVAGMLQRLSHLNPHLLRDLQRFAPELHELLAETRRRNIPYVFGRLLEDGKKAGMVRAELDTAFAAEFFLQAMQGLLQASATGQLGMQPREIFEHAMQLFFTGLLTPAGRKAHEKQFSR